MNTATRQISLNVQGMTCRSCAAHVEKALRDVAGVEAARVDLAHKTAVVSGHDVDVGALLDAVREAGYTASADARD